MLSSLFCSVQDKTKRPSRSPCTYFREPQSGAIIPQTEWYKTENRLVLWWINQQVQLKLNVIIWKQVYKNVATSESVWKFLKQVRLYSNERGADCLWVLSFIFIHISKVTKSRVCRLAGFPLPPGGPKYGLLWQDINFI